MFGIFGRQPKKSVEEDLIPELKRQVVQIRDSTGASYLAIAAPLLSFGISLVVEKKGLAHAISILSAILEEEQQTSAGSLSSSIIDIKIPEPTRGEVEPVVKKLADFAARFINKEGYSFEEVGGAMAFVSGEMAKRMEKNNFLGIGLLRKELKVRRDQYRREQFSQTANGERCTEESINILLQAESHGFTLTVERDRTFALAKEGGTDYLRSNFDIQRFGAAMKREQANRSPVEKLVEQGHKHLQDQNLDAAVSAFSAALRITPDSRDIYFHRGVTWSNSYYNRGRKPNDLQKAVDDFTRSIEIDPGFADGYFQRAQSLSAQLRTAEAIADYSKCIEMDHNTSSSYFSRALLLQSSGEKARAIADFDGAIRTGDKDDQSMALMSRGEAQHDLGNLELALDDFNAAAAYYPKGPPGLYEKRGALLLELGRRREAIADFSEAIAAVSPLADPRFIANMYEQRGHCRTQLGEVELGRQDLEHAAMLRQQNP